MWCKQSGNRDKPENKTPYAATIPYSHWGHTEVTLRSVWVTKHLRVMPASEGRCWMHGALNYKDCVQQMSSRFDGAKVELLHRPVREDNCPRSSKNRFYTQLSSLLVDSIKTSLLARARASSTAPWPCDPPAPGILPPLISAQCDGMGTARFGHLKKA